MNSFVNWCKSLTMEQMFILTEIGVLLIGTGLGLLGSWLAEKGGEDNENL